MWTTTGVVMAVAVLAASSRPVQIWVNPEPTGTDSVRTSAPRGPSSTSQTTGGGIEAWPWLGTVFNLLGIALLMVLVVASVKSAVIPSNPWARSWRWRWRWRLGDWGGGDFEALPEVVGRQLDLDVAAARSALAIGAPRNAIVACWMRLEGDAATVGLERLVSETSAEYTERVVASASLDPAPIGELAGLYREARFSDHAMDDRHRERALAALSDVERGLTAHLEVAP